MSLTIVCTPEWRGSVTGGIANGQRIQYEVPPERPTATAGRLSSGVRSGGDVRFSGRPSGVHISGGCASKSVPIVGRDVQPVAEFGRWQYRAMQSAAAGMIAVAGLAAVAVCWRLGEFVVAFF